MVLFWFVVLMLFLAAYPFLVKNYVDKVKETLSRVESVRKFTILPKKLYEEDGEVTPTMKVKRNHVNKDFKELIDAMMNA